MKKLGFLIGIFLFLAVSGFSQPLPPPVPQDWYPIDTVVAVLLIAGVVLGVKMLKRQPKAVKV